MSDSKPTLWELFMQSLQDVQGGYDLLAPKFDQSRYITPDEILAPFFKKLVVERGAFDNGIDICCGTGAASKFLVQLCRREFSALDLSHQMLYRCEERIRPLRPDIQKSFIHADALAMPFRDQFDVAVSFGAFGHIAKKDEQRFIAQIHKILKPGGQFFFITTERLPMWSISLWRQRMFNWIISIRNLVLRPKFIMYYLTFRLPEVKNLLESGGFEVRIMDNFRPLSDEEQLSDLLPLKYFKMVVAEKKIER